MRDGESRRRPAYVEVLRALRRDVTGQAPGSPFPSERELAARFAVGRMTVRTAMRVLSQEGLLVVQRGAGAFVAERRVEVPGHSRRAAADGDDDGRGDTVRVLRFDRVACDAPTADALLLAPGDAVFRVERLLLSRAVVVAHERIVVAVATCPSLFRRNVEQRSVADLLAREGIVQASSVEEVRAAAAGRAFAALARVRASDPVLIVRRIAFSTDRQPVEFSVTTCRADRYHATYEVALST